jgi:O-antigen/teichoic acid export membrane protein
LNGLSGFSLNFFSRGFNLLYGLFALANSIGLILGEIVGKIVTVLLLIFSVQRLRQSLNRFWAIISFHKIKLIAAQFKSFPLYYLPSTLLIYFSGHLPLFFFQWEYGPTVLGAFALASSLLEIFNKVIPYAMAPAVLQKMKELKESSIVELKTQAFRLFSYLMGLSLLIFIVISFFSEVAFRLAFGDKWLLAGTFASLLTIHYAFNFVSVAISELYNVLHRQKFLFVNSTITMLLRIVSLLLIYVYRLPVVPGLFLFSIVSSIGHISLIFGIFHILKYKLLEVSLILFSTFAILSLVVYFIVFHF